MGALAGKVPIVAWIGIQLISAKCQRHTLKIKTLLFCSDFGCGVGSVFHHHSAQGSDYRLPQPNVGFFQKHAWGLFWLLRPLHTALNVLTIFWFTLRK